MKKTPIQLIEELATLDVAALQKRHAAFFGKEPPCGHRQFLFRKLAWHVQAKAEGGLPASALELAKSIAMDTPLRVRILTNAGRQRAGKPLDNYGSRKSHIEVLRYDRPGFRGFGMFERAALDVTRSASSADKTSCSASRARTQ